MRIDRSNVADTQANDMVWTEEELDRWALLEVHKNILQRFLGPNGLLKRVNSIGGKS